MSEHRDFNPEHSLPHFREIPAIEHWSAQVHLDIPYDDFLRTILLTACETGHRYKGVIIRDPTTGQVKKFIHTRLPRNKYGKPTKIDDCENAMNILGQKFDTTHTPEDIAAGLSRIVLGLYEGQHDSGARSDTVDYSIDELQQLLGCEFEIAPAEVFSARFDKAGPSYYSEPVAVVIFPTFLKEGVYLLGDTMKQERFSVEDFLDNGSVSYMVETRWCKETDPIETPE